MMSGKHICISAFDRERLQKLLSEARTTDYRKSEYLRKLHLEMERATIVQPKEMPGNVITLNSRVCLEDVETGEEEIYTLVFPEDADFLQGKISILAPIGTAMFGYEVGDTFEWDVPEGKRSLRVKEILYQPEASGDYHL
ncbi:MAG: nucleoside diphosphate kinase regulator [Anaerolineaceae bacterium]|nr:nucleoside diphosphate kinase regulator [Anaerolineaceae bacterium]